jgi:hypothetical protein
MMTALSRLFKEIASLRLTIICLAAALVLVFAGTLAQVRFGLYFIQEQYFQSWLVWWVAPSGSFKIPMFPGGHLIGAVLLVNLLASLIHRFRWAWRKLGIQLIHVGLIIMLAGGLATDVCSVTSSMRLKIGETKNYSEDSSRMELVAIDLSDSANTRLTAIPAERLATGGSISHESLPFTIVVRGYYRNSDLKMIGQGTAAAVPAATQGAGASISVQALPRATKLDDRDNMSAVVEIIPAKGGSSLGTWLVSANMAAPQNFEVEGRTWSIQLRPTRYYKPYSMTLQEFTHEVYPGSRIPKNYSSKVSLDDTVNNEHRQVAIYMNHPLRYLGDTYYQSGFEADNSGTILQVVRNPSYQAPYVACVIVSLGLIFQFTLPLTGFARRAKPTAAP